MKVGRMQSGWIMGRTLWTTLFHSLSVIIKSLLGCLTRESVNRSLQVWCENLLNIVNVNLTVKGEVPTQLPDRRYILMSNHASHYDIPITISAFPSYCIRMIAKKELFRVPIWGKAMQRAEFMSIDRENRKQALQDLEVAKEKLSSGITTWAAPEGTRTRTGEMGPFKKGPVVLAIQTEAIIIPFAIKGSRNVLPADTWQFSTNETVEVKIGQPIDAKQYTLKQRNELVALVEQQMRDLITDETA